MLTFEEKTFRDIYRKKTWEVGILFPLTGWKRSYTNSNIYEIVFTLTLNKKCL